MSAAPLRVASVGAGYFAQFQIAAWHDLPGVALAGLCDTDTARAAQTLERIVGPGHEVPVHARAEELFAAGAEIIDIATPPATHAALIAAAIAARPRLIVCQKPFCGTQEAALAATEAAEAAGVPLVVHENVRFQPWYRRIKAELAAGRIGEVFQLTMRLRPGDGQGAQAYLDRQPYFRDMERFLVHETGIHWIDTFRYLLGEPRSVFADLRRTNSGIAGEDAGMLLFRFDGAARAIFDANRSADHAADNRRHTMGEFTAEGAAGTLALDGYGRLTVRAFGANEVELLDAWAPDGFGAGCVRAFQQHVLDGLTTGAGFETGARDYLRNLAIEEQVYASADAGRVVALG
ncbi:probable NADH-dependent dyhydrogenase [Oceanicola granulosus HTCC2516]|uniref:Probable NADH-dependent dyhydrogenase n=1 Tax=Oceanicola granulosus (strain ATCC BAA-861 / DSM 15982 / KCTC 12143 / HTCC2516) TaxID=314256 RepID=Q2CF05_OCEGH|nr:Gfo/Idh/MocA family oxidoreductase [Oceanicola granulosus]EAR51322.1 probable NADH-dependent dyhydrogenase [Oceanicola granulosus HTCC2516]